MTTTVHATPRIAARRPNCRARSVFLRTMTCGALVAVLLASVAVGTFSIAPAEVVRALLGSGADDTAFVVGTLRLPRALTGALVGALFGASGSVFQSLVRNPLASPDVIGVTAGASAAAVATIVVSGSASTSLLAGAAAAGALVTAGAIYVLAWRERSATPYRLVLVGIGLTAALSSATAFLLTRTDIYDAQRATVWLTGSLNARTWEHARIAAVALAVVPLLAAGTRLLRIVELGDDLATGLGIRVGRTRLALLTGAVIAAAAATAAAGPIGFIALAAPQIARRLDARGEPVVALSAAVGAVMVAGADDAARTVFSPTELPVGVVTAAIGAPYLLWLLSRTSRTQTA